MSLYLWNIHTLHALYALMWTEHYYQHRNARKDGVKKIKKKNKKKIWCLMAPEV